MKYIVVYILFFLLTGTSETAAQKPAIILLPTAQEHIHPEVLIDTCFKKESRISDGEINNRELKNPESEEKVKNSGVEVLFQETGNNPLLFNKLISRKIFIHLTALIYNL